MSVIEEKHSKRFVKSMSQEPYAAWPSAAVPRIQDFIPFYRFTIFTASAGKKE